MRLQWSLVVIVLVLYPHPTTGLSLPSVTDFLNDLANKILGSNEDNDEEIEVTSEFHREKRQSPDIGDESPHHYEIRTSSIPYMPDGVTPNDRYMPTVGNGHIAGTIYDDGLYMNGLYEGTGSESHRAKIPNLKMSRIFFDTDIIEQNAIRKYVFNAQEGVFMETIECEFAHIEHRLYAHQKYMRVFVSDIHAKRKVDDRFGGILRLRYKGLNDTDDIDFEQPRQHHSGSMQVVGRTKSAEEGAGTQSVYMFWTKQVFEISLMHSTREANMTMLLSVDTQESTARSEFDKVMDILNRDGGYYQFFSEHKQTWQQVWDQGRIEVEGHPQLAKLTTFSQLYLLSSLPAEFPDQSVQHSDFHYGVARNSLAKGRKGRDYHGHIFYDNEMHILPAMILFHPNAVKKVMRYRTQMAPRATDNAQLFGAEGYHFPFQSGYRGAEVSSESEECSLCEWKKFHVSGAVSWLIRQYYSATGDRDYMLNPDYNGCDMTREIAKFYADRAEYNPSRGRYDIKDCTGPDEWHPSVTNNAYTLVQASLAIHWARYFACLCQKNEGVEVPNEWIQKALYMNLPFDNVRRQHFQHEGFDPEVDRVSQADTIMLGYPLNWNMSLDIQRNDLDLFELVTDPDAPALTWSFFAVGYKWVGETAKARQYFEQSYNNYLIQPFKVWTEFNERNMEDQAEGSVNFLPGMGGFLQSLVFGYAGIRIRPDILEFHRPEPPPGATRIKLIGLQYLQTRMTVIIETDYRVSIEVEQAGTTPLILRLNDTAMVEEELTTGTFRQIDNARDGFFIYSQIPEPCEHPRDFIYMPWGYSHWVDSASSLSCSVVLLVSLLMISLLNAR